MQTYATPSQSKLSCSNHHHHAHHHRSVSLCNYDELLCRTRKRSEINSDLIQRKMIPITGGQPLECPHYNNDNQDDDEHCCEECPLNNDVPCDNNNEVKGHRRSLSLRQQFEYGYDYIRSEWEQARELAGKTVEQATKTVSQATGAVWKVCHFNMLPNWMQDNEYLHTGHRPPLPTFWACIKSIFRLHTETGNIWTHGIGALLFVGLFIYEFVTISAHKTAVDRLMLTIYFCGIIMCLLFSYYCGISIQIIGSMTPALYYGFYEDLNMFKLYISFGVVLCILSIAVSLWDKFGEPQYRGFRAMVFLCFGLSNVIPGVHWYLILDSRLLTAYYLFILQGALYVIGSLLYANRIPERLFPGKCDYMFQSHQIFHVLVVLAAFVHLNGINLMAESRLHNHHNLMQNHSDVLVSTTSSLF
ncbi:adiponectin receptor protein isoform X3 [Dermatophagoides farinae]|uniref:adiponectin receptor protein isoform X3 n=1 Tax=Dermatophagoides farinae TaxID=6954 RepID=UPI003F620F40